MKSSIDQPRTYDFHQRSSTRLAKGRILHLYPEIVPQVALLRSILRAQKTVAAVVWLAEEEGMEEVAIAETLLVDDLRVVGTVVVLRASSSVVLVVLEVVEVSLVVVEALVEVVRVELSRVEEVVFAAGTAMVVDVFFPAGTTVAVEVFLAAATTGSTQTRLALLVHFPKPAQTVSFPVLPASTQLTRSAPIPAVCGARARSTVPLRAAALASGTAVQERGLELRKRRENGENSPKLKGRAALLRHQVDFESAIRRLSPRRKS